MKAAASGGHNGANYIGSIDNITKTIHIHPSLSEVIVKAAYDI
jgi:pyruvate/2-oxoglutarate dehydrogenase complex dihydrolipoamide dehydrogenase (E3) component